MVRVRADDYDTKCQSILDSAAALFAKTGYPGAKMQDIAKACGATKSMLYHYFPTKDDLLLALLTEHLERLIVELELALSEAGAGERRFANFIRVYVQKSAQSRQRHLSAMNDVKFLPVEMQPPILQLQAKVVTLGTALLRELRSDLPATVYKPYALLLLGMLNWTDLWYKPEGTISPQELCDRIQRLFLHGFLAEKAG